MSEPASPLVTVLLPVKDGMPFLPDALKSIRQQTFRDFELLVIDDGSTDGTAAYLASVKDPRLRVIRNEVSQGVALSLNRGMELARSPLIARQDADDASLPERLARQVEFMRSHPECFVVGTQGRMLDAAGLDIGPYWLRPIGEREIREDILRACPFIHGSVMMRRDAVLAAGGYRPKVRRAEDYDLWLRLAARGTLANLPDVLYHHRIHDAQVGAAFRQDAMADTWLCQALNWERTCMGDGDSLNALTDAQLAALKDRRAVWRPRGGWRRRVRVLWNYARFLEAGQIAPSCGADESPRRDWRLVNSEMGMAT